MVKLKIFKNLCLMDIAGNYAFSLKQIEFYNINLLIAYLSIRYKVFIKEFQRKIIGEFSLRDTSAKHYAFSKQKAIIGIARVIYLENTAELGRIAILKEYRNKGYGIKFIKLIIEHINTNAHVNVISIYTEDESLIEFYKQFGFTEKEEVYFNNNPYMNMIKLLD